MIARKFEQDSRTRSFLISTVGGVSLLLLAVTVFAVASQARSVSSQAERAVQTVENLRVVSLARAELSVASRVAQVAPNQQTVLDGSIDNALSALESVSQNFDDETSDDVVASFDTFEAAVTQQVDVLRDPERTEDQIIAAEIRTGETFAALGDVMRAEQLEAIDGLRVDNDLMNLIATISTFVVAFVVPSAALFIFQALRRMPRDMRMLQLRHDQLDNSSRTMAATIAKEAAELRAHLLSTESDAADPRLLRSLLRFEHIATVNRAPTSLRNQQVDISDVIDETLGSLDGADEVELQLDQALFAIVDRSQLGLVTAELVNNAIMHGDGPIRLTVSARDRDLLIEISDHGDGLPDLVEDAVLHENQYALRGNVVAGSYGFGLLATRRALESMGGSLRYERENATTRFAAEIPQSVVSGTESASLAA